MSEKSGYYELDMCVLVEMANVDAELRDLLAKIRQHKAVKGVIDVQPNRLSRTEFDERLMESQDLTDTAFQPLT